MIKIENDNKFKILKINNKYYICNVENIISGHELKIFKIIIENINKENIIYFIDNKYKININDKRFYLSTVNFIKDEFKVNLMSYNQYYIDEKI